VQRVAAAMSILALLAVIAVGVLYVKTNLNPKGSGQCKEAIRAEARSSFPLGLGSQYGSLEERIDRAARSAAESAIAGERRALAKIQRATYCRSHWTDPWVWFNRLDLLPTVRR
jgi:hypothetical protein